MGIRDAPEPGNLPEPEPIPWLRRRSRSWHKNTLYNITIKKIMLEIFDIKSLKTFFFSKTFHIVMFEACGAFRTKYVKKFEVITKKNFIIFLI